MIPLQVQLDLAQAAVDAGSVAGLGLSVYIGIKAIKYMRRAIEGGPGDYYQGYSVIDDMSDRAIQYQADRITFDADGNASFSDPKRDFADAAKDVIRNQSFFGGASKPPSFPDAFTTAYQYRLKREAGDRIAEAKGWDDRDHPW